MLFQLFFALTIFTPFLITTGQASILSYDLNQYCNEGWNIKNNSKPSLQKCHPEATACAMLEFKTTGNQTVGMVMKCFDESMFIDEYRQKYTDYCDDRPKCREVNVSAFTSTFLTNLDRTHSGFIAGIRQTLKFCCSFKHDKLFYAAGLTKNDTAVPIYDAVRNIVHCAGRPCAPHAEGCFSYTAKTEEATAETMPLLYNRTENSSCLYRNRNDMLEKFCRRNSKDSNSSSFCYEEDAKWQVCWCFTLIESGTCNIVPLATPSPVLATDSYVDKTANYANTTAGPETVIESINQWLFIVIGGAVILIGVIIVIVVMIMQRKGLQTPA